MDRKSFFNEHNENLALAQIVRETMLEQEQQQQHVNDDEEDTIASGSSGDSNLRNASMWVAVPDNYEEDDAPDDYLDGTMCINDIHMGEFLNDDSETDDDDDTTKNVGDVYMGNLITEEDMIRNQAGVVVSTSLSTDVGGLPSSSLMCILVLNLPRHLHLSLRMQVVKTTMMVMIILSSCQ